MNWQFSRKDLRDQDNPKSVVDEIETVMLCNNFSSSFQSNLSSESKRETSRSTIRVINDENLIAF